MTPLGVFSNDQDRALKEKISIAIRQLDVQHKELEQLRIRLEERRRSMFDAAVKAIEKNDEMRAQVLCGEHVELQKITRVVNASEIALLHIRVRLETIRDVGDVMYVLTTAFKAVKKIGKSVAEVAPNLEKAASEINNSFSDILAELGPISSNVTISLTDGPTEIFNKAQQLISERTNELSELPATLRREENPYESIFEKTKRVALLATEEDEDADEVGSNNNNDNDNEFKPVLMSSPKDGANETEYAVRNYLNKFGDSKIDVLDASIRLNLPVDRVEQAYIKVLAEKKFTSDNFSISKKKRANISSD